MSLREKHRQLMSQSGLNDELLGSQKAENQTDKPTLQITPKNVQNSAESAPAPSPISVPSSGLSRPKLSHVLPPTEADLKRKAYLAAAKERNDKTQQEFESRVKGYFEKGLAIEQQKMSSSSKVKKSNKEKNAEAVENGLFMQQLKQIGIDVGKMNTSSQAMKPTEEDGRRARPSSGHVRPSASMTTEPRPATTDFNSLESTRPAHYSASSTSMTPAGLEARIANIERIVTSLQHTVSEHDKKLETSIQLQRQILSLLTQRPGEVGSTGGDAINSPSLTYQPAEETNTSIRQGRRNRRY